MREDSQVDLDSSTLLKRLRDFVSASQTDAEIRVKYFGIGPKGTYERGDTRGWKLTEARSRLVAIELEKHIVSVMYRPFDRRHIFYHSSMVYWPREKFMLHLNSKQNIALVSCRQSAVFGWEHCNVTNQIVNDCYVSNRTKERGYVFPLYLYPETSTQTSVMSQGVQPNLDAKLVEQLANGVGLTYRFDANNPWDHGNGKYLMPLDVLDYCYAVLHSPAYREKYKEFLKSDFPRIPYPTDVEKFRALVQLGALLRRLHLLEEPTVETFITKFPALGDNTVTRKMTSKSPGYEPTGKGLGNVWINDDQYFADVPEVAWNFYIGGYQPAQKWLKDRVGRQLTFDDIRHYQRMIVALQCTSETMREIDSIGVIN